VLGRDGTPVWDIQTESPAAGHVFAKTGTFAVMNRPNWRMLVTGKGLAGHLTTPRANDACSDHVTTSRVDGSR
jgi:hypothetical protein